MIARGVYWRRRGDPWRWPAAVLAAVACAGAVALLTPRAWLRWFLSPTQPVPRLAEAAPRPWLELVPPPEIEVVPRDGPERREPPPAPPVAPPADWWREGWNVRVAAGARRALRPTPADSAASLLRALGLPASIGELARPDSVLAMRLLLLRREDALHFDELAPYFSALARARGHADLQSRVAAMYDHFLAHEIMAPD